MLRRIGKVVRLAAPAALLMGCAALQGPPGPTSEDKRFSAFRTDGLPVSAPVTIRWNDAMIPFIEAETDADAAFAMGYVHAHLRLGMLALARRAAQGRISESAGPFTIEIDAAIRAFDFGRASDDIYSRMPAHSREWLDRFAEGVNAYADRLGPDEWPHEFAVGAIDWEPWRPTDSLLIGRGSGIDINWGALCLTMINQVLPFFGSRDFVNKHAPLMAILSRKVKRHTRVTNPLLMIRHESEWTHYRYHFNKGKYHVHTFHVDGCRVCVDRGQCRGGLYTHHLAHE